jgi:hypothetical protein
MTAEGPGHHVKELGGRVDLARDGFTLRVCFAFAGRLTGRHRNHDAATVSLAGLATEGRRLMGGIFSTLWSGDDGAVGSRCAFCGTPDGPFLEVEGIFALLLCADCQAARSARRSAELLADHDPLRLWWQWGCPLCEHRASAPWDLEGHTARQHPGWTARFEIVRPYPRQLLRVIYHRSDPPGSEARLDACVVRQRPRLRQAGSLARLAT